MLNRSLQHANPFTQRHKIRAGIGVFDNEGNELEWDYEHDTRIFEENEFNEHLGEGWRV